MVIRRNLTLAVLGTSLLASALPSIAGVEPPPQPWETEIVWHDSSHSDPLLLPQGLLSAVDWSDPGSAVKDQGLHLTQVEQERLRELLTGPTYSQAVENLGQVPPSNGCVPPFISEPSIYSPAPGSLTLPGVATSYEPVFVGEVVDLVDGFKPSVMRPATRVMLRVSTVLRDPEQLVTPGAVTSFIEEYGSVFFGSRNECQEREHIEGFYSPKVGDQILFAGVGLESDQYVQCDFLFQVVGDTIVPQSLPQLAPGPLPSLTEIEEAAAGAGAGRPHE